MGLHTGPATPRDGDYLAPALNRLARLLSAGAGGQIVLTQTTPKSGPPRLSTAGRRLDAISASTACVISAKTSTSINSTHAVEPGARLPAAEDPGPAFRHNLPAQHNRL